MTRSLLLCLTFLTATTCLAAQTREITTEYPDGSVRERYSVDDQGRKQGSYELLRRDGSVMLRKSFRDNVLHGVYEELARDGEPTLEMRYRDGVLDGKLVEYGRGGEPVLIERYDDGELDGRRETFDDDGRRIGFSTWKAGELDGPFEEVDRDGRKRAGDYAEGLLDGKVEITRQAPNSRREVTISEQYWENGRLVRLDGIEPFPIPRDRLRDRLAAILEPPAEPSLHAAEDPMWPERAACLRILQAYRALCRLPYEEMQLHPVWNQLCDAGSELCRVIGHLDHTPPKPPGMDDEAYRRGYEGTSHSNLHRGGGMARSVDGYMDDSDPSNIDRVGHRRWCLNPAMQKTGFGEAGDFAAMWSMDGSGGSAKDLDEVMYPPPGWVPSDFFGPRHAWSIATLKGGMPRLDELVIEIRRLDDDWVPDAEALELDHVGIGPGGQGTGPCLIFRPVAISTAPGSKYVCTIREQGERRPRWQYVVAFCEPIRSDM